MTFYVKGLTWFSVTFYVKGLTWFNVTFMSKDWPDSAWLFMSKDWPDSTWLFMSKDWPNSTWLFMSKDWLGFNVTFYVKGLTWFQRDFLCDLISTCLFMPKDWPDLSVTFHVKGLTWFQRVIKYWVDFISACRNQEVDFILVWQMRRTDGSLDPTPQSKLQVVSLWHAGTNLQIDIYELSCTCKNGDAQTQWRLSVALLRATVRRARVRDRIHLERQRKTVSNLIMVPTTLFKLHGQSVTAVGSCGTRPDLASLMTCAVGRGSFCYDIER